jgi:hypothetical protein
MSIFKILIMTIFALLLNACGESRPSMGPDLTGIADVDHAFYNSSHALCSVNNTKYDCNCVARQHVNYRNETYATYKSAYESTHKPKLMAKIEELTVMVAEKIKNHSDPRIIESHSQNLSHLKFRLEKGVNSINDFDMPALPAGATDQCVL